MLVCGDNGNRMKNAGYQLLSISFIQPITSERKIIFVDYQGQSNNLKSCDYFTLISKMTYNVKVKILFTMLSLLLLLWRCKLLQKKEERIENKQIKKQKS